MAGCALGFAAWFLLGSSPPILAEVLCHAGMLRSYVVKVSYIHRPKSFGSGNIKKPSAGCTSLSLNTSQIKVNMVMLQLFERTSNVGNTICHRRQYIFCDRQGVFVVFVDFIIKNEIEPRLIKLSN